MDQSPDISDVAGEAQSWLLEAAMPLWFERGVDWNGGGFHEHLTFNDLSCGADFKRLRVLARQIYVFSAASRLGFSEGRRAVEHGVDYLFSKARTAPGEFANRFDRRGSIIDQTLDLYDLSFCLFALAHAHQTLKETIFEREALSTAAFIYERMKHKSGGYIESIPASYPRRQNPHMHLLEAVLAWRAISDEQIFKEISDELVGLFFDKFYCARSGALLEFFDDQLNPPESEGDKLTEPGHHFEWVWLLDSFSQLSRQSLQDYAPLYHFAKYYGVSPSDGFLFAQLLTSGEARGGRVRLWPHAEWLKAELVTKGSERAERVFFAWRALSRFLDCPRPGLWFENYDLAARSFINEPAPASSLYHITLAIETLSAHANAQEACS